MCALAALLLAETAHAQTPPPGWYLPQYPAHLSIQAPPSTELEVVFKDAPPGSPTVAHCKQYCDFWAWPGRYTLYARDNTTQERKELSLRVNQSARYLFEPGDDNARKTGLALGVGGSIAIMAGFLMMTPAVLSQMCEDTNCTSSDERDAATAGLVVLLAGAIATPVGWIMFAHNGTHLKQLDGGSAAATKPQVRVGVVGVGQGGLGLGGLATF